MLDSCDDARYSPLGLRSRRRRPSTGVMRSLAATCIVEPGHDTMLPTVKVVK